MRRRWYQAAVGLGLLGALPGCATGLIWACKRPEVTAVSLNPCDGDRCGKETGIPFYLPKPLLIVAKNFRNIEEAKVGLTDSPPIPLGFDDQAKYADLNARTNFNGLQGPAVAGAASEPSGPDNVNTGTAMKSAPVLHSGGAPVTPGPAPSDGLAPATFYTYHMVFVPDLTQKYGLKIRGGPGEIRAAMNLVNGWQFTGIGPFYLKDSSTAQNVLASGIATRLGGQAAADVLNATADLARAAGSRQGAAVGADEPSLLALSKTISDLPLGRVPMSLPNFAEIRVYEARLTPEGLMEWVEIVNLCFNRDYLGAERLDGVYAPKAAAPPTMPRAAAGTGAQGAAVAGTVPESVARTAVAGVFGLPVDTRALTGLGGRPEGAAVGGAPAGGVNQIQVDCGGPGGKPSKEFNLFRFGPWCKEPPKATIQNRTVTGAAGAILPGLPGPGGGGIGPITPGGGTGAQGAAAPGLPAGVVNQPIYNHPYPPPPMMPPADKKGAQ